MLDNGFHQAFQVEANHDNFKLTTRSRLTFEAFDAVIVVVKGCQNSFLELINGKEVREEW